MEYHVHNESNPLTKENILEVFKALGEELKTCPDVELGFIPIPKDWEKLLKQD